MKTIFIPILQGVEAKNILRTDIYRRLIAEPDVKLVFLVASRERRDYYEKEFNHERVAYEVLPPYRPGALERVFSALKFKLINNETFDLRRRMKLEEGGNHFSYFISWFFNRVFARRSVRQAVRLLDYLLIRQSFLAPLFDRYRPSIAFLAHLFDDVEIAVLREAKKRGIKSVGFVNSWDKLTARAIIRLLPDELVVFNQIVKKEAIDFADMPSEKIFIGGIPNYDCYLTQKPASREEFFRSLGVSPDKRLIVYAPNGKYSTIADGPMIDLIHSFITRSLIPNAELLVRFQPNDEVDRSVIEKRPWLIYDIPGVRFSRGRGVDWDMTSTDIQRLIDTLYHSSLLMCYTSSLSVDAAIFKKPVININFELEKIKKLSQSPIQYYQMTHYKNAIASGGIRVVSSSGELLAWINNYLKSPQMDEEGRERLVREQCGELDGRAGKRIAEFVLSKL